MFLLTSVPIKRFVLCQSIFRIKYYKVKMSITCIVPKQGGNRPDDNAATTSPATTTPTVIPSSSPTSPDILDPNDPSVEPDKLEASGWKFGAKRILNKTAGMFKKLSTLLLKIVKTIFPWNRRARRRLSDGEDEEE